ncbi:hypothetical protein IVA82_33810 [Bradyrhizobium sp. 142]|nr:hypothetical protein [Bradyrhizobium sp. 142]
MAVNAPRSACGREVAKAVACLASDESGLITAAHFDFDQNICGAPH